MFGSGKVSVISGSVDAGNAESDADGSAAKLCQPLCICIEFDCHVYIMDLGLEFVANLQRLVKAFGIHSRKFLRTNQGQVTI